MTEEEVADYLANECGGNPLFDHYDNVEIGTIHLIDNEGNGFCVTVRKEN